MGILAQLVLLHRIAGEADDLVVDNGAGLEGHKTAVTGELVLEGLLGASLGEIGKLIDRVVERRPFHLADTLHQRGVAVIIKRPLGVRTIIGGCRPAAGIILYPVCTVGCMTGREDGRLPVRSHADDFAASVGSHLQLIAHGAHGQRCRRAFVGSELAGVVVIGHTLHRTERLAVEPPGAHDSVLVWTGACDQTSHSRCTVGGVEGVFCLGIYPSLLHEPGQPVFAVEGDKGLQIIASQLVNNHIDHQSWNDGGGLCFSAHDSHEGHERTEQSVSGYGSIHFLFLLLQI